jgi:hypothetical protein
MIIIYTFMFIVNLLHSSSYKFMHHSRNLMNKLMNMSCYKAGDGDNDQWVEVKMFWLVIIMTKMFSQCCQCYGHSCRHGLEPVIGQSELSNRHIDVISSQSLS